MAFTFGAHSVAQRATLHDHLQRILDLALEVHDLRIQEGARTPEAQWAAFNAGNSKVRGNAEYPHRIREDGRSWAVDVYPVIDGKMIDARKVGITPIETAQFTRFLGIIEGIAWEYFKGQHAMTNESWRLRFGINWDRDQVILADQTLQDFPHIELERVA